MDLPTLYYALSLNRPTWAWRGQHGTGTRVRYWSC